MLKKSSQYRFPSLLVFLVIIILMSYSAGVHSFNIKSINTEPHELQYGETFPKKVTLFSASGKKVHPGDIKGAYKVLFYLDSAKPDCIFRLKSISKIIKFFDSAAISFSILWYSEIPFTEIKEKKIDPSINYSFKKKYAPSQSTPTAFIVDKDEKVILVSGYDYFALISKVNELSGNNDLRHKVNDMIVRDAQSNKNSLSASNNPYLLLFVASGCRLCLKSESLIKDNALLLESKFNTITVRPDFNEKTDYDFNEVTDDALLYFNVYNNFYHVTYPVYVILNKQLEVERVFSDIKELLDYTRKI